MYEFFDLIGTKTNFMDELTSGLKSKPKYIPGYYIYDKRGSKLFERICGLPEYYLTRTEMRILDQSAEEIVAPYKEDSALVVELGSGNLCKTDLLLRAFLKNRHRLKYIPIDISGDDLKDNSLKLYHNRPGIDVTACCGEYLDGLNYLDRFEERKLILWLGSSIGNFSKRKAPGFLKKIKGVMHRDDGLLVGIDLKKDPKAVERAYNDSAGVTSAYHLNVLHRFNREFGADFRVENFYHRSFYDSERGAVEAFIISNCEQTVCIRELDLEVTLKDGERIFNELSCKYDPSEIETLAQDSGFSIKKQWFDKNNFFTLVLFE